jgi:hypothetical protein
MKRDHSRPAARVSVEFWRKRGNASAAQRREVAEHIESPEAAARYCDLNVRALVKSARHQPLAAAIAKCAREKPCGKILCACCGRRYRLWLASEILAHISAALPAFLVSVSIEVVPGRALPGVDVDVLHERVRKRLIRAGVLAAIGGTEASYGPKDRWTVHLHLVVFGKRRHLEQRLRGAFSNLKRAFRAQNLRNPIKQITYIQKFATYHRPGCSKFGGRGRAYPLKRQQILQLAKWTEHRRFEDFLFLLGIRRRGSRFVAERGLQRMLDASRKVATWRRGDVATRKK